MTASRDRLRQLGQLDLGAWIEAATGRELWSIQQRIATQLSHRRARIVVPSCNASGKTHLAARLALAFYDAYTPGAPCQFCDPDGTKGGCRGSKVLTTSSKETHLRDNLWGEIRLTIGEMAKNGLELPGTLPPVETFLMDSPGNHFIRGQVATKEEGMQGYHAAHKLIIGDEATAVGEDVARGITSLMATGDTRLLLVFNPTTPDTYAAQMTRSPRVEVIRITAYDTPAFTGEAVPEGSNLTTPEFLLDLEAQGMGPGTYEWTTRVLAQFWDQGEDTLIAPAWVDAAEARESDVSSITAIGVDLAPYGTAESAIAVRSGDTLIALEAHPAGRTDHLILGDPLRMTEGQQIDPSAPVPRLVVRHRPTYLIYDADGVGAGAIGDFEKLWGWAVRNGHMGPHSQVIGFRGGKKVTDFYLNARSGWWWALRRRFERGRISMRVNDPKTRAQLTQMTYSISPAGAIRVETKGEMKQRGLESPDRADAIMYAYAFSEDLPDPNSKPDRSWVEDQGYGVDRSEAAMWKRMLEGDGLGKKKVPVNAVTGIPDQL
jgi:hypothetical protein